MLLESLVPKVFPKFKHLLIIFQHIVQLHIMLFQLFLTYSSTINRSFVIFYLNFTVWLDNIQLPMANPTKKKKKTTGTLLKVNNVILYRSTFRSYLYKSNHFLRQLRKKEIKKKSKSRLYYKIDFVTIRRFESDS